jgi:hypothetical protein
VRFSILAGVIVCESLALLVGCSATDKSDQKAQFIAYIRDKCPAATKAEKAANQIIAQVQNNELQDNLDVRKSVYAAYMREESAFSKCAHKTIVHREDAVFSMLAGMSINYAIHAFNGYAEADAIAQAKQLGVADYKRALALFSEDIGSDTYYRYTQQKLDDLQSL